MSSGKLSKVRVLCIFPARDVLNALFSLLGIQTRCIKIGRGCSETTKIERERSFTVIALASYLSFSSGLCKVALLLLYFVCLIEAHVLYYISMSCGYENQNNQSRDPMNIVHRTMTKIVELGNLLV